LDFKGVGYILFALFLYLIDCTIRLFLIVNRNLHQVSP
jgi:hypothetical protein